MNLINKPPAAETKQPDRHLTRLAACLHVGSYVRTCVLLYVGLSFILILIHKPSYWFHVRVLLPSPNNFGRQ